MPALRLYLGDVGSGEQQLSTFGVLLAAHLWEALAGTERVLAFLAVTFSPPARSIASLRLQRSHYPPFIQADDLRQRHAKKEYFCKNIT